MQAELAEILFHADAQVANARDPTCGQYIGNRLKGSRSVATDDDAGLRRIRHGVPQRFLQLGNRYGLLVEHDGEIYRLVLTRNNKLLLLK